MHSRRVLLVAALALATNVLAAPGFELEPGLRVLAPLTHEQLTVFPVVQDRVERPAANYLTLAQGLKSGEVTVSEKGAGGEVNQVTVANRSSRPLLLLGGEVILGGQQDRVMSQDTVVEPKARQAVAVFCVEHGRWSGQGQFNASGGFVESKARRIAKYDQDQSGVWSQVASKTSALGAQSGTGTYRTLAVGEKGQSASKAFRDTIGAQLKALPESRQLVGLIAAVNGTIRSVELFASPELFSEYRERLLDSMFIDAADVAMQPKAPEVKEADIKAFVQRVDAAPPVTAKRASGATETRKTADTANSTLKDADGKPVFRSYQNSKY